MNYNLEDNTAHANQFLYDDNEVVVDLAKRLIESESELKQSEAEYNSREEELIDSANMLDSDLRYKIDSLISDLTGSKEPHADKVIKEAIAGLEELEELL